MKTLNKKFQLMAKTVLCTLLIALGSNAYAQLNVQEIGEFVLADEAQEWMANFEFENQGEIFGHLYGKQTLKEILSQEGAEGLKIFNGLDEQGVAKLVFYAANSSGQEFGMAYDISAPCPPFCGDPDGDQRSGLEIGQIGGTIEKELANQWTTNFNSTHPFEMKSALFGNSIITNILNPDNVKGLYFANAIDIEGQPQIVLVSVDQHGTLLMNYPIASNAKSNQQITLSASK